MGVEWPIQGTNGTAQWPAAPVVSGGGEGSTTPGVALGVGWAISDRSVNITATSSGITFALPQANLLDEALRTYVNTIAVSTSMSHTYTFGSTVNLSKIVWEQETTGVWGTWAVEVLIDSVWYPNAATSVLGGAVLTEIEIDEDNRTDVDAFRFVGVSGTINNHWVNEVRAFGEHQ